ncbi:enoyl-CoA hydratase-related protein [Bradyrhizobium sp. AS23.2]|uniref:enoyl-CoA hydratase-related protein n=1 Tax=Bradyrhizobium sp. AS23.2 TaxID=1680155 RepID=UPI000AC5DF58|nr:enoyl-CoA hydratase-related protein [Bradyrhizobium sp. AS23.2]
MSDRYAHYKRLQFDRPSPRVLRITMSNPGKLNAADQTMHGELGAIWRDVDADPEVSAVILTGAGNAFSAGGEMDMIDGMMNDFNIRARNWKEAKDIVYNVINCSKPVVSAIRGPAVGAGLVCPGRHLHRFQESQDHRRTY